MASSAKNNANFSLTKYNQHIVSQALFHFGSVDVSRFSDTKQVIREPKKKIIISKAKEQIDH